SGLFSAVAFPLGRHTVCEPARYVVGHESRLSRRPGEGHRTVQSPRVLRGARSLGGGLARRAFGGTPPPARVDSGGCRALQAAGWLAAGHGEALGAGVEQAARLYGLLVGSRSESTHPRSRTLARAGAQARCRGTSGFPSRVDAVNCLLPR